MSSLGSMQFAKPEGVTSSSIEDMGTFQPLPDTSSNPPNGEVVYAKVMKKKPAPSSDDEGTNKQTAEGGITQQDPLYAVPQKRVSKVEKNMIIMNKAISLFLHLTFI